MGWGGAWPHANATIGACVAAPAQYVAWMNQHLGFNPRSQQHSDALSDYVVADLRAACAEIDADVASGQMVVQKNRGVQSGLACRDVDLILEGSGRARVSVEHKTIMAAHGKARKNRYGDLIAYCNHMHQHSVECVVAAIVVINTSPRYENPDAFARGLKRPKFDMGRVIPTTVDIFASIPQRDFSGQSWDRPEALAVILVSYDGVGPASLVDALPERSNVSYENFLERTVRLYRERFTAQRRAVDL